ncbi:MAG: winged helix DNA-binding protein [Burkholderiaceae bacterium]|nr:winged helix DNA-binding protein [Burkholderiaceae bacterium]MEB2349830.1 winged helix DNA-binding protein [Burkholderiaceae bacterium]
MASRPRGARSGAASVPVPVPGAPLRILSSAHLADGDWGELSEFEFGLIVATHAFDRWAVRCMAAAGMPDLTITDVLVLHHVHHRGKGKKLADICFTLNYEDAHVVAYALRKLTGLGLVRGEKSGKEVLHSTTPAGAGLAARYRAVRDRCLVASVPDRLGSLPGGAGRERDARGDERSELAHLARMLRTLSGLYDQAARAAASL